MSGSVLSRDGKTREVEFLPKTHKNMEAFVQHQVIKYFVSLSWTYMAHLLFYWEEKEKHGGGCFAYID